MLKSFAVLLFVFSLTNKCEAQSTKFDPDLVWANHTKFANVVSYIPPIVSVTWGIIDASHNHKLKKELIKDGLLIGIAEGTKAIIHRNRPDNSDNKSFFSEHTELSASLFGQNKSISVALTFNTAYLRTAAGKHYLTDTIVGAVVGSAVSELMK